ncbi:MAG: adenine deaminase [Candidatus Methanofastidiosia archaeon]|jgi:adenine deaminase
MNITGNLVNVFTGDIYPAEVTFNTTITRIKEISTEQSQYILPGFIDSHIHIESSMLCPSRFAQAVVPHGTTSTVSDPHEIANVMGIKGITYMVSDTTVLKIFYSAPSCVPATAYETSGAVLCPKDIKKLFEMYDLVSLGEVMNFPGVVSGDKTITKKIEIAKKYQKLIDGHAPGVTGGDLQTYIGYGITTDHECTTLKEAQQKQNLGMYIMMREGTASKNLKDLLGLEYSRCFLVSDDLHPEDIKKGHIDVLLQKAVSYGIDPVTAVKMVTVNPANHYKLNTGALAPGKDADMVIVNNLSDFSVEKVFINGKLVAKNGKPLFSVDPVVAESTFCVNKKDPSDFAISINTNKKTATVRVISVIEDQLYTKAKETVLHCSNGHVLPDITQDILKLVVVERYGNNRIGKGFVTGFKLQKGALASSVAHDSHNIIAVGVSDEEIAKAVNTIIDMKGGIVACNTKKIGLELPVAGLMSYEPLDTVCKKHQNTQKYAKELGCTLQNPFMQLSFLALLVIPELKLSDKGLFDSKNFEFVDVII